VSTPDTTPVFTPIYNNKETYLKQTSSPDNYHQLKLQTLELWCLQQHKLGNPPPAAGDRYQIMRPDHA